MKWLAVFLAVTVADAAWSYYIRAAAERRPLAAGTSAVAILVIGGFTTLAYVHDPRYLLPAGLGAFVGTYLTVRRG